MVGKTGKDFNPSPAEVTEREFSRGRIRHESLKAPPGGFKSFPAGDLLKETMLRKQERFGFCQVWAARGEKPSVTEPSPSPLKTKP